MFIVRARRAESTSVSDAVFAARYKGSNHGERELGRRGRRATLA